MATLTLEAQQVYLGEGFLLTSGSLYSGDSPGSTGTNHFLLVFELPVDFDPDNVILSAQLNLRGRRWDSEEELTAGQRYRLGIPENTNQNVASGEMNFLALSLPSDSGTTLTLGVDGDFVFDIIQEITTTISNYGINVVGMCNHARINGRLAEGRISFLCLAEYFNFQAHLEFTGIGVENAPTLFITYSEAGSGDVGGIGEIGGEGDNNTPGGSGSVASNGVLSGEGASPTVTAIRKKSLFPNDLW